MAVTSQLTDPIKWPIYLLHIIAVYVHVRDKEAMNQMLQIENIWVIYKHIYIYILMSMECCT